MKQVLTSLFILLCPLLWAQQKEGWKECRTSYQEIQQLYKAYEVSNVYLKYTQLNKENGVEKDQVTSELWIGGKKFRFKNDYIEMIQDASALVMVMTMPQKIMVMEPEEKTKENSPMRGFLPIDSLQKITEKVWVEKVGNLTVFSMRFKASYTEKYKFKFFQMAYNPQTKEIKEGVYHFKDKGILHESIYYYHVFQKSAKKIFSGSALSQVQVKGKLREAYQLYSIKDLRKDQLSK